MFVRLVLARSPAPSGPGAAIAVALPGSASLATVAAFLVAWPLWQGVQAPVPNGRLPGAASPEPDVEHEAGIAAAMTPERCLLV